MALTALQLRRGLPPGLHHDGDGLYLQVGKAGGKSWLYRFRFHGKLRHMGLGSADLVGLAEARELARDARKLARSGVDPIDARRAKQAPSRVVVPTFDECAARYIEAHRPGWKDGRTAEDWYQAIRKHASPVIGALPVSDVVLSHVLEVLEPLWATMTPRAGKLRGRIENIIDWATVRGYRNADNPARWKGHLDKLLPARAAVHRVQHHRALPYQDVPAFLAELRTREGMTAKALEFLILTAARSGEVRGAIWDEFDLDAGLWVIPGERMKMAKAHRVPLVGRSLEIVKELAKMPTGDYVFPAPTHNPQPLSGSAFRLLTLRMDRTDVVPHGFRSSFRDWCAEQTAFPHAVCELALAHHVLTSVERAYQRSDLLEKRQQLMEQWDKFCSSPITTAGVTPIRAKASL